MLRQILLRGMEIGGQVCQGASWHGFLEENLANDFWRHCV
jgi:hypothetical protein